MNFLRRAVGMYNACLKTHRLKVQAVQISALMGMGDVFAQKLVEKQKYDPVRTLKFMSLGLVLGPVTDKWFMVIDNFFGREMTLKKGVKKALLDQAIGNPVYLTVILGGLSFIEGKDYTETQRVFKENFLDILLASYMVWPAVQIFNFTLVPSQYRVLTIQTVEILWNTYLSWKTHQDELNTSKNF
ncbi:protein Mpv17-like [Cimex lectularius]|uniref:Mitochondrial inner membrane protein Mpv17 n=1 Tax=Cimex lectularius TaxID=79782 RepID=A0A8I6RVZ3_CIMLE|nr:protein Mpv17-like [Cimex lectularius]